MATASLARRALCPQCIQLGGCELGIPGLIPVPRRGDIGPVTGKSKSYVESLIEVDQEGNAAVTGLPNAVRCRPYPWRNLYVGAQLLRSTQARPTTAGKEEKAP